MTQIDDHGRPEPPMDGSELETLLGFLDFQRATLEWKCAGLDGAGLSTTIAASTMSLGGILKHMAIVEDNWFSVSLHGRERSELWVDLDWDRDPDWEWRTAREDDPDQLRTEWRTYVERSRTLVDEVLAGGGGLDQGAVRVFSEEQSPNLRWILCHMIEEYARHNGHADLLREAVDGETGE